MRVDVRTEAPGDDRRKPTPVILSEKELHYYDVQMAPTEADALIAYRCLTAVVARARHRGLRIQDQHRDAASGDAESQGNE